MRTMIKTGLLSRGTVAVTAAAAADKEFQTIFDGTSGTGWILCDKKPLPKANVQADGLNPHGIGELSRRPRNQVARLRARLRLQAHQRLQLGGLHSRQRPERPGQHRASKSRSMTRPAPACTIRVRSTTWSLPRRTPRKPAGEWNHMTITAKGPKIAVVLNDKEVSTIDLDQWNEPGKRPDGSSHKFDRRRDRQAPADRLPRLSRSRQRLLVQEREDQGRRSESRAFLSTAEHPVSLRAYSKEATTPNAC